MNPWLRELARILAAVAVEDIADESDELASSADAVAGRDPREHGSNDAESSRQSSFGDRQHRSLFAEEC